MRDPFYVDWLNSDSREMTDAALDEAALLEAFLRGALAVNDDEEEERDAA
jgi:hypothetical protein